MIIFIKYNIKIKHRIQILKLANSKFKTQLAITFSPILVNIISLSVLPSTFNQPNSKYYVKIDANFVKQSNTLEPLLGISKYKWIFSTGNFFKYYI